MGEASILGEENPSKSTEKYRTQGGLPDGLGCVPLRQCFSEFTDQKEYFVTGPYYKMKKKEVWGCCVDT